MLESITWNPEAHLQLRAILDWLEVNMVDLLVCRSWPFFSGRGSAHACRLGSQDVEARQAARLVAWNNLSHDKQNSG